MPPRLKETLASMGSSASSENFNEFLQVLGGSLAGLIELRRKAQSSLDVSELDADDLSSVLRSKVEDVGQGVLIAWPADSIAAKVAYSAVLDQIDDLWYPSMDDLVIIGDTKAHKWVMILDHEEQLVVASLDS